MPHATRVTGAEALSLAYVMVECGIPRINFNLAAPIVRAGHAINGIWQLLKLEKYGVVVVLVI